MPSPSPDVVIVARKPGNAKVLAAVLAEKGYTAATAANEQALTAHLDADPPPGLALVDVSGFGREVWRWCETIHLREVPFVVLSTPDLSNVEVASTKTGARSVLKKPIGKATILMIVEDTIARQRTETREDKA